MVGTGWGRGGGGCSDSLNTFGASVRVGNLSDSSGRMLSVVSAGLVLVSDFRRQRWRCATPCMPSPGQVLVEAAGEIAGRPQVRFAQLLPSVEAVPASATALKTELKYIIILV